MASMQYDNNYTTLIDDIAIIFIGFIQHQSSDGAEDGRYDYYVNREIFAC